MTEEQFIESIEQDCTTLICNMNEEQRTRSPKFGEIAMLYYFKYKKLLRDYEELRTSHNNLKEKYKEKCRERDGLFGSLLKLKKRAS